MNTEELHRIGRKLYGDEWQTPLAKALGVTIRQVQRWAAGAPIKRPVEIAIRCLLNHGGPK